MHMYNKLNLNIKIMCNFLNNCKSLYQNIISLYFPYISLVLFYFSRNRNFPPVKS